MTILKLKHANAIVCAILSLVATLLFTSNIVVAQQKDQDIVEARLKGLICTGLTLSGFKSFFI